MAHDWTKLYREYKGLWVALAEDESTVLASGVTASEVFERAKKAGYNDPILTRVPHELMTYVGYGV